jgi:hypothetical protein
LEEVNKARDRLAEKFQGVIKIGLFGATGEVSGARLSGQSKQNAFANDTHPAVSLPNWQADGRASTRR